MTQSVDMHELGKNGQFRAERGRNGWVYITNRGGEIAAALQPAEWLDLFTLLAPLVVDAARDEERAPTVRM